MSQISAAVTDLACAGVLIGCAYADREEPSRWWSVAFASAALGSAIGAVHHLAFPPATTGDSGSAASFAAAGAALAISLASLLTASLATVKVVRGEWIARLGWLCSALFVVAALAGKGTVGPLVVLQLPTMISIVGVWLYAARKELAGAREVLASFIVTAASALAFVPPTKRIGLSLDIDPVTFQHLLQLPGLAMIALAVRWRVGNVSKVGVQRRFGENLG
ncbi:DUF6962 family protein [Jatrophihabitans sp. DSM 45814]